MNNKKPTNNKCKSILMLNDYLDLKLDNWIDQLQMLTLHKCMSAVELNLAKKAQAYQLIDAK